MVLRIPTGRWADTAEVAPVFPSPSSPGDNNDNNISPRACLLPMPWTVRRPLGSCLTLTQAYPIGISSRWVSGERAQAKGGGASVSLKRWNRSMKTREPVVSRYSRVACACVFSSRSSAS